jgi:hypothetical protein
VQLSDEKISGCRDAGEHGEHDRDKEDELRYETLFRLTERIENCSDGGVFAVEGPKVMRESADPDTVKSGHQQMNYCYNKYEIRVEIVAYEIRFILQAMSRHTMFLIELALTIAAHL